MNSGDLADEIRREIGDTARANLSLLESEMGDMVTSANEDAINLGVEAGFLATMQVLVRRGILKTADASA